MLTRLSKKARGNPQQQQPNIAFVAVRRQTLRAPIAGFLAGLALRRRTAIRCAALHKTAPLRGSPPPPPNRALPTTRLQSPLDKNWGQRQRRCRARPPNLASSSLTTLIPTDEMGVVRTFDASSTVCSKKRAPGHPGLFRSSRSLRDRTRRAEQLVSRSRRNPRRRATRTDS